MRSFEVFFRDSANPDIQTPCSSTVFSFGSNRAQDLYKHRSGKDSRIEALSVSGALKLTKY